MRYLRLMVNDKASKYGLLSPCEPLWDDIASQPA